MPVSITAADGILNAVTDWQATNDCRQLFQSTTIDALARFSNGNSLQSVGVTQIVRDFLTLSNPAIATLQNRTLTGIAFGETDILAVRNGSVIGKTSRAISVTPSATVVVKLDVFVTSALKMTSNASEDLSPDNVGVVTLRRTSKFHLENQQGSVTVVASYSDSSMREVTN